MSQTGQFVGFQMEKGGGVPILPTMSGIPGIGSGSVRLWTAYRSLNLPSCISELVFS